MSIWKSSIVTPIPKPDNDFSRSTSYRRISLLYPAAKVREALLLPTICFHPQTNTVSDPDTLPILLQLTSVITTGFNQRKPPHRTVCVVVDLTAAFNTVNHNILLSKIVRSTLSEATCRWLSSYLRARQSVVKSKIVRTFINKTNNTGTKKEHWCTPLFTSFHADDSPLITTFVSSRVGIL